MNEFLPILIPIFFIISMIYAAAGFGGGSSYLAVLALFPLEFTSLRMIALLCNIIVVSGSLFIFYKHGFLKIRKALPLILLSVPFAYLGGRLKIEEQVFFMILGITLLIAAVLMLIDKREKTVNLPKFANPIIGGGIGFLSGLVGIGGGIFLSPFLYLTHWEKAKTIAATTAGFIFVNSIAGLIGQINTNGFGIDLKSVGLLLCTVFIGGQIGSRLTVKWINPIVVKKITAFLILFVAIRILI
jgi:uncharacterized membrane protein YfcA